MKKKGILVCVILAVGLGIIGCGGKYVGKTGNGKTASGSAVSDYASSGSAVSGDTASVGGKIQKGHRFATDTNFYLPYGGDGREDREGFAVYLKKDPSQVQNVKIARFSDLLYVTEEGVYYFRTDHTLWRMPIEKRKEGTDWVKQGSEEKILEEKDGIIAESGCYVNESCLAYITYEGNAVKYDRRTGKKSIHPLKGNIASLSAINDRCLIIGNMYGGYIHWDLREDIWMPFLKDGDVEEDPIVVNGDFYYYVRSDRSDGEEEVWLYDAKTKENTRLVSGDQLDSVCEAYVKEQGGEYQYCDLWNIFSYKDKLYVEMQVDWRKNNTYWMKYVTFCSDREGKREFSVAQDWMDFKEKNSHDETIHEKVNGCKKVVYNASSGIYMVDGKIIMLLGDADDIACYDLVKKTGKIITEKNQEYYLPYYDTSYDEVYPDWQMEGGMNFVPEELDGYWGC